MDRTTLRMDPITVVVAICSFLIVYSGGFKPTQKEASKPATVEQPVKADNNG